MHSGDGVALVWGTVAKRLPSQCFEIVIESGDSVLAAAGGKVAREAYRIRVGDRVRVQLNLELPVPARILQHEPRTTAEPPKAS